MKRPPARLKRFNSKHSSCLFFGAVTLLLAGCSSPLTTSKDLRASCLDVAVDGESVHLLFGTGHGKDATPNLFWKQTDANVEHWTQPVLIPTAHARPGNHGRGNDPQIAAYGSSLMALWTAKGGGPYGSGPIATALSNDGGKTWRPGPSPTTGSLREDLGYRFPATAADQRGFHVVWIHAEDKERSLRYARLDFGAMKWTEPVIIDETSCACCWNELKISTDGKIFVLYRDEEPKDMALAMSADGGKTWSQRGHVGAFAWEFQGCPHVGGGLDVVAGNVLFATVWTGHPGKTGAYILHSSDGGSTWSVPVELKGQTESGRHTDTAALSAAEAASVWDQQTEDTHTISFSSTSDGGKSWSPATVLSEPGRTAKYPRIIMIGNKYLVLWSEYDGSQNPRLIMKTVGAR